MSSSLPKNDSPSGSLAKLFVERPSSGLADALAASDREQFEMPAPLGAVSRDYRQVLRGLAALSGTDAAALIADYEKDGPLARAVRVLLDLEAVRPGPGRGRPVDLSRDLSIYGVVQSLRDQGHSQAKAIAMAPKALTALGIYGTGPLKKPMTTHSVRRALQRYPRVWFEPFVK